MDNLVENNEWSEMDPEEFDDFMVISKKVMALLDVASEVPIDSQVHAIKCPLCGKDAVGRISSVNHHVMARCECIGYAHRTWHEKE